MIRPSMLLFAGLALVGCGSNTDTNPLPTACTKTVSPSSDDQTTVTAALVAAKSGDTICFASGTFKFKDEIDLAASGVTLRGQKDTIFDFTGQKGANGILINANDTLLDTLQVENTAGDGIRANDADGITFRNVSVVWTGGSNAMNGGYGLYPVQSQRVLVENCKVDGASDAGIYVGQSKNIVVRNNEALHNVAGIEIENSTDAEVYGNHAHDNVGGILVFALPDLPMKESGRALVHDNIVENNNTPNFAKAGAIVSRVPSGTGLLLLASDHNEFAKNTVQNNDSVGLAVVSWKVLTMPTMDTSYDQYPEGNFIHENTFMNNGANPHDLAKSIAALIGETKIPEMVWDGEVDPMKMASPDLVNCFDSNGSADFIDFDFATVGMMKSKDITPYTCKHTALPPIDPKGFPGVK